MSCYIGPKCRLCRREGIKLFLKGTRCDGPKCAVTRRAAPPGEHPWKRGRPSDYGIQLREKQRFKRFYGVLERQFRLLYQRAFKAENKGEKLCEIAECRLDNVVYLAGLAHSRSHARQMVVHGHVRLNKTKSRTPAQIIRKSDIITISPREKIREGMKSVIAETKGRPVPSWISFDDKNLQATILELPRRDETSAPVREQLIVEFCSK